MQGKILGYNQEKQSGMISGDDGKRYPFTKEHWESESKPIVGLSVDFEIQDNQAVSIYSLRAPSFGAYATGEKNKIVAGLLALFLGVFGAHKFYLGYSKQGIILFLCFIPGILLFGIPPLITATIAVIEAIIYLTKTDEDFAQIYVNGKKPWF